MSNSLHIHKELTLAFFLSQANTAVLYL